MTKIQGFSEDGGKVVVTNSLASSTFVQKSYPSATITVYLAGTTTLASIYSDNASTPKANPFTAASDGAWFFYVNDGNYDVKFSGGGIPAPFTLGDLSVPVGSLNVKSFGAVGNGVVNDYTAIVNAQAAAQALGANLYFPAATYSIGTALVVSGTKTSWQLDPGTTLKYTGGATAAAVTFDGTGGANGQRFDITNLTVDANGLATTAILIKKSVGSNFTNLIGTNATNGIWCSHCVLDVFNTPTVSTNVTPFTTVPVTGMIFDDIAGAGCSAITVINPRIEGVSGSGIKLVFLGRGVFVGGTSESNGTGVELNGASSLNVFANSFIGLDVESNSVLDVDFNKSQDNTFYTIGGGTAGIKMRNGGGLNRIIGGQYTGTITVDAGSSNNEIADLDMGAASIADSGTSTIIRNVIQGSALSLDKNPSTGISFTNAANGMDLYFLSGGTKNGVVGGGAIAKLQASGVAGVVVAPTGVAIGPGHASVPASTTLLVQDPTAVSGATRMVVKAGAADAVTVTDPPFQVQSNAGVQQFLVDSIGGSISKGVVFASLPSGRPDGYRIFCTNCQGPQDAGFVAGAACNAGGTHTGAWAERINGSWICK